MLSFYRGATESILSSCIRLWFGSCTAADRKSLQRIVNSAQRIIGASLPSLQDIYNTRLTRKALSIVGDPTHPSNCLFTLLPSARRFHKHNQTEKQLLPGCQEAELSPPPPTSSLLSPLSHLSTLLPLDRDFNTLHTHRHN